MIIHPTRPRRRTEVRRGTLKRAPHIPEDCGARFSVPPAASAAGEASASRPIQRSARILAILCVSLRLAAQGPAVPPSPATTPANFPAATNPVSSQNPFQGSVSTGIATSTTLRLSLQEAFDRGLKTNLGLLTRDTNSTLAQAERIRALSALLPNVVGELSETVQQLNLASFGFHIPGFPTLIGPFAYSDAHASAGQTVFDRTAIKNRQSASQNARAAQLSAQDGRDLVVQAVASAYLQIIADG